MKQARRTSAVSSRANCPCGFAYRGLVVVLPLVLAVPVLAWFGMPRFSLTSEEDEPIVHVVQRSEFIHDITERGNVESASNVEIASKVKSSAGGTTILEVVPEGTLIKPEHCIPEDSVIPLEELVKYQEWRKEHQMEITDLWPNDHQADSEDGDSETAESGSGNGEAEASGSQSDDDKPEKSNGSLADGQSPVTGSDAQDGSNGHEGSEAQDGSPDQSESKPQYGEAEFPALTCEDLKGKMVLVTLNAASLDNELTLRQIVCEKSRAEVTQAETSYETAVISKQEYLEGTYQENKKKIEGDIYMAEVYLARAQEYFDHSKLLHAKGFISDRELQANQFDVEKKKIDLERAKTEMEVLEKYAKVKTIKQLEANIQTLEARLAADKKSYALDLERLREVEEQLVNCTVFSTKPGQVVYANERNHRYGNEIIIEPGTMIRERQVIIRLPDPTQMEVKARINEARINLVEPGMEATIRLDAFLDEELRGIVEQVGEYPAPSQWYSSNVKEYEADIKILNPPAELRPGFTAMVEIRVAQIPDVLQVPVQAVLEHGGKHYCVLRDDQQKGVEAREVKIGLTNDKFVVIHQGLEEGDEVVLNAKAYRDDLGLPELPEETEAASKQAESIAARGGAGDGARPGPESGQKSPGSPGATAAAGGQASPAQAFKRWDRNADGKLQKDELPSQLKQFASQIDKDADGTIDISEWTAAANALKRAQAQAGGSPRAGPAPAARPASQPRGGS